MQASRLTAAILLGMIFGIAAGYVCYQFFPGSAVGFSENISLLPTIFLRLIKMIIAPLVFATLVAGIARMGDAGAIGRIGGKAMGWFISASILSLSLGLVLVNALQPGKAIALTLPAPNAHADIETSALSVQSFIAHAVPVSVIDAMARNEILQIVVFALFFGGATAALGDRNRPLLEIFDLLALIMLKITTYVMLFAPLAVFGALASTVAKQGLGIIAVYGVFMGEFYLAILALWLVLIAIGALFIGPRVVTLLKYMREPLLLAFATASSEAAYPKTLEGLQRFGVSNKISSFILPLGYSFNLDGSMMYCTFAVMFIAQAYGIDMPLSQQIMMLAVLMLTSKGIAGVPRASLVVIAATLSQFNIPEAGLLLLLGIDHFLDMGRSATNVIGNSLAAAVVARWEGDRHDEEMALAESV
jgi:Na+/H+-dicarboxylate symporter